ncbi:MAG: glucan biosynthesis protein G [Pseudomonadota bacterium]
MTMNRRGFMAALAALAAAPRPGWTAEGDGVPFSRDWLVAEAEALASRAYEPRPTVPDGWLDLDYDQYRMIWFNHQNALFRDSGRPLEVDMFPAGLFFEHAVEINTVQDGNAYRVPFNMEFFDTTDGFPNPPVDDTMGYSGLRLRAEMNSPGIFEEFMVFQGASYFRTIANGQTYGLSARGLAIKTGDPMGEEFPAFTRFFVEAPEVGATHYMVHAILDGPSVAGAYSFRIADGMPAHVEVEATLFPRVDLDNVGIAPLTSMFLFDDTNHIRFDDFRPGVHDSEGLMIWNGAGERLWRPLANHETLQISYFIDTNPRGFGLVQRDRDLESYGDFEARYDNRPTLWITPRGEWGPGSVQLVEIPADLEIYDNIVAFWRPRGTIPAGQRVDIAYDMAWGDEPPVLPEVAPVINTRIGGNFDQQSTVVAIDFGPHPALTGDLADYSHQINASNLTLSGGILERHPTTGGLRLAFSFDPEEASESEMRAQLRHQGEAVTEVWLYRWTR